jgi:hypothetical protein
MSTLPFPANKSNLPNQATALIEDSPDPRPGQ